MLDATDDSPVEGASVIIGESTGTTGSAGGCTVKDVEVGEGVSVSVTVSGYIDYTDTITVTEETDSLTVKLTAE